MASIIRLLPDHIANQIAAGEVVQRPASVVKELLENAIDAGATSIELHVNQAGKGLIQVIDNGKGMNASDAQVCFERHATSKLASADDLFNIQTKGFRGEALSSIAAVAHVELITKPEDQELGTRVNMAGSKISQTEPVASNTGTSIAVKNLFFNIPARRNFLKSDQVEFRHIIDEFQRVAIPHHGISFLLMHNKQEVFNLSASNSRQRIVNIFGHKYNERIAPIEENTDLVEIKGFVGKASTARKTRGEQYFFVNQRFIKNNYLHHAIKTAYEGLIPADHHPSYFVFLELDPSTIDINIHPTKTEIKFEDEKAVYAYLKACIRKTLGQFQVAPSLDFSRDPDLEPSLSKPGTYVAQPRISVNPNFNPFDQDENLGSPQRNTSFSSAKASKGDWSAVLENLGNPDAVEAPKQEELLPTEHRSKLFQLNKCFIVSSLKSGLVLIDQQKAHERICFEELLNQHQGLSQQLLFPQEMELNPVDLAVFKELLPSLTELGMGLDITEKGLVEISGLPLGLAESEAKPLIERFIEDAKHDQDPDPEQVKTTLCKRLARSLAIKKGKALQEEEMHSIVDRLFACAEPNIALNGTSTYIQLELEELEKRFENG